MPRYNVTLSKEAAIFLTTTTVDAETIEEAEKIALQKADAIDDKDWEYNDDYFLYEPPRIQVEGSEEVMA